MSDRRAKDHATTGRLLLATTLKYPGLLRKSVLDVYVPFLEDPDAVASDHHVLRRVHVYLDHYRPIDFPFNAGRRVLAADAASLVEHVGRDTAEIRADENLKGRWFVVAD